MLVVFDGTPSNLLEKLSNAYKENSGEIYLGDTAWELLKAKAGKSMAKFIEKYIEPPIEAMIATKIDLLGSISLSATPNSIFIADQNGNAYVIHRNPGSNKPSDELE